MRHPRRRHRKTKHIRWMVRASARPVDFRVEDGVWHITVERKHRAPWTPARARSKHWIDV